MLQRILFTLVIRLLTQSSEDKRNSVLSYASCFFQAQTFAFSLICRRENLACILQIMWTISSFYANTGSDTKICTSLYKWAWKILSRDTETLAALTYSMANRCEAIIAADGMQKISNSFRLLTLNPWSY